MMKRKTNDFVDLNAPESEDGEIVFKEKETSKNDDIENKQRKVAHKNRLQEIDNEMLARIQELHKMMEEGGLQQSATMLEKCSSLLSKEGMWNDNFSVQIGNSNANAAVAMGNENTSSKGGGSRSPGNQSRMSSHSKSLETI